jgi:hypothetical protein
MSSKIFKGEFTKVSNKIAYGFAYVSTKDGEAVVDHSGDVWDINEVEKTAHLFMTECRTGGDSHVTKGGGQVVESIVFTKAKQDMLGIDLGMECWFIGMEILDADLLAKVEKGDLTMFSIGGSGTREEI